MSPLTVPPEVGTRTASAPPSDPPRRRLRPLHLRTGLPHHAHVLLPRPGPARVDVVRAGDLDVADDVLAVRREAVPRAYRRGQARRGAQHRVREVLRAVDPALVLDADAALVEAPVARVERDVQLADRLREVTVAAHHVVRRRAVRRVLEDLERHRIAALHDMDHDAVHAVVPRPVRTPPVRLRGRDPLRARLVHGPLDARPLDPRRPPPQVPQLVAREHPRAHGRRRAAHEQRAPAEPPAAVRQAGPVSATRRTLHAAVNGRGRTGVPARAAERRAASRGRGR
ncbi:putative N-acetylmuramoyl-L-alanine amidase [Streptomyces sp. Tu6071]|nr:putative N-acetylmuramoyl-L-alanine amidase [Streptomyces sp. Tu6071]